jgi:hypothetical protein
VQQLERPPAISQSVRAQVTAGTRPWRQGGVFCGSDYEMMLAARNGKGNDGHGEGRFVVVEVNSSDYRILQCRVSKGGKHGLRLRCDGFSPLLEEDQRYGCTRTIDQHPPAVGQMFPAEGCHQVRSESGSKRDREDELGVRP